MKKILALTVCLMTVVTGCEAALPEHDPALAWVEIRGRAGYSLSAWRQDGKKVTDARYFQLEPGRHRIEVRLGHERKGNRSGSQWRHCRILFDYEGFAAGARYDIYAIAMGHTVRAWLRDDAGKRLQESRSVRCGSQY